MPTITVAIASRSRTCPVRIESGLCRDWRGEVEKELGAKSHLAVMDDNVASMLELPASGTSEGKWRYLRAAPGETDKTLAQYGRLCEQALAMGIDRKTVVVALGGGVVGDIAGFMAATLLRGLRLVQIPTTLLAQVDSSVGGKTGVNAAAGKNLIGAFHQPDAVLVDPLFLDSLPRREYLAGMGEVVKCAILSGRELFDFLMRSTELASARDHDFLATIVAHCCRLKAHVVSRDETERDQGGGRALLNLGHTFGHALEALAGYDGRVVHGEAVAVGCALAAAFAVKKHLLPTRDQLDIIALLSNLDLPARIGDLGRLPGAPPLDWPDLLKDDLVSPALLKDKKAEERKLNLVLPHAIGDCRLVKGIDAGEAADFMREWAD